MPRHVRSVLLSAWIAFPAALHAQGAVITGRVSSTADQPIAGAIVTVQSLRLSTQTNEAGLYRLSVPTERAVSGTDSIRVTRIGYRPRTVAFATLAGPMRVDVTLTQQAIDLEQVVVTGTAGNQERRAQAATVASVDASALVKSAPITNVQQLLTGRVPGVSVNQSNGSVGSTSVIRIRGISSISLSNEPLVFVDGVRMDNRNLSVAGGAVSTLNSIDPNEIESIEIVKGPAAATLYGADASTGVIQIITKRGRAGTGRFSQQVTGELSTLRANWTPPSNFAACSAASVAPASTSTLCRGQAVGTIVSDNPLVREHLINDGTGKILGWQGRGGGQSYGYFLSYGYTGEMGTVPQNGVRRQNARTTFNFVPNRTMSIDAGFGLVRDVNDQVNVGDNIYGILTSLIGSPLTVGSGANGWFTPNRTGVAISNVQNRVNTTRFLPSVQMQYAPVAWFTNRLTLGGDISRIGYTSFFPKNDQLWYAGNNNLGLVREDRGAFDTYTLDYLGDIKRNFGADGKYTADLSFGSQVIARSLDSLSATGYGLATNASNTVSSATTISAGGSRSDQRFVGFLGQLQLGWRDRLFVQFGARVDQNSAFANASERFLLPKLGVSYVLSDEPFWHGTVPFVNTLRLRAAYGTTGRSPQPGSALETYSNAPYVLNNGSQAAGVVPANPGNQKLRAERGRELEAGFDAAVWNDRVGLDFTFFNKVTSDLLLQRPIAPSLGFTTNPFVNIGEVVNRGLEASLRASVVQTRPLAFDARLTVATLHNEITSLGGISSFNTGVNGVNQYRDGQPIGVYFSPRVKSVDVARGVAIVSDTTEFGGNPFPEFTGTMSGDLTLFGSLRASGLFEFKRGYELFNASQYFREKAFTQEERYQRRASLPDAERIRLFGPYQRASGASVPSALIIDDYIQDASFLRFRELSVTYTAPARLAQRVAVSSASLTVGGRNLALWTKYRGGWDPESITYVPATGVSFTADFLTMPQPQRFFVRLNLGF